MEYKFYRDDALEAIARNAIKDYDASLLYAPAAIPIEGIMEKVYGLAIVYQHIMKNGQILGETAFDDTWVPVYDKEEQRYLWLYIKRGTVIVDAGLLQPRRIGRLRFTLAHELAHWIIHQYFYAGSCKIAALLKNTRKSSDADAMVERQADFLASVLLLPAGQVKMCFHRHRSAPDVIGAMAKVFEVSKQAMEIRLKELRLV